MKLTVKSATIQFGEGQTVGLLVGFEYYEGSENLYGSVAVPLANVTDMQYATLARVAKEELIARLGEASDSAE